MSLELGKPLKSLVLAAGYGTRLRPLTDIIPKPLATVCGVSLLEAALFKVKQAGATAFAVNTHHLHDVLKAKLPEISSSLHLKDVFVSHECDAILGTGGALVALCSWWGDARLLVYNGDILSDMTLSHLTAHHERRRPLVTMAVRPSPPKDGGRSVWVDRDGYVCAICQKQDLSSHLSRLTGPHQIVAQELREFGFACAYIAEPGLLNFLPAKAEFYDLISGLQSAISHGQKILSVNYEGFWADVGTPQALWRANLDVGQMTSHDRQAILGRDLSSSVFAKGPDNVVSALAKVDSMAHLKNTVLLDDARVEASERLTNHIRGFGLNQSFEPAL